MHLLAMLAGLPLALGTIALIVLHACALGYWGLKCVGYRPSDWWGRASTLWASGLALLGAETLLFGHLGLLRPGAFLTSAAVMLVLLIPPAWKNGRRWLTDFRAELESTFAGQPVIAWTCAGMLTLVAISAMRPPFMVDEMEYHRSAPMLWSHEGRWVHSPYRGTNGPALGEILYTVSAVLGSPTAAHWTHSLFLVVLLCGCAALTRSAGGGSGASVAGVVAACLSCPVIVNQSSVAYNDLMASAFAISAYVPIWSGNRKAEALGPGLEPRPCRSALFVASMLFTAAVSVKFFLLASIPIAAVYAARPLIVRGGRIMVNHRRLPSRAALIVGPALVVLALWNLRAVHVMRGSFFGDHAIVHSSTDPMWLNGTAAGRIPTLGDVIRLPLVPFLATLWGQQEPYGGRIGLLLLAFAPIGIYIVCHGPQWQRSRALWLLAAGVVSFFLLGPVAVKTRFHIFFWAVLCCFAGIGYNAVVFDPRVRSRLAVAAFAGLMFLGMADIAHVLVPMQGAPNRLPPSQAAAPPAQIAGVTHE
jgi:hypothetical protein